MTRTMAECASASRLTLSLSEITGGTSDKLDW